MLGVLEGAGDPDTFLREPLNQAWKNFEEEHGSVETMLTVRKMMPKRVKRRRKVVTDDEEEAGWEEYLD